MNSLFVEACLRNIREVTTNFLVTNEKLLGKPTRHEVLDKGTKRYSKTKETKILKCNRPTTTYPGGGGGNSASSILLWSLQAYFRIVCLK